VNKINGGIMMKDMLMRLVREEDGQGLTEYGLVVAMVAAVVIAVMTVFGTALKGVFTDLAEKITEAAGTEIP
jgi:pilus assembly protein Flp/PilA